MAERGMLVRKAIDFISGSRKARIAYDDDNSRLDVIVGTTRVGSFDATNGYTPTVPVNLGAGFRIPVNDDVAAAGSSQADAAQLAEGLTRVTDANGTKGVILPVAEAGMMVFIKGDTAGVLKVYPASGGQINAVGADTAMSLASGKVPVILIAASATQWYTFPLVPS